MGHYPLTIQFPTLEALIASAVEQANLTLNKIKWSYRKSSDSYSFRVTCGGDVILSKTDMLRIRGKINSAEEFQAFLKSNNLDVDFDIYADRSNNIIGFIVTLLA